MNKVKDLISAVSDTDIVELTLEKGSFKLVFKRDKNGVKHIHLPTPPGVTNADAEEENTQEKNMVDIKSTMVGTFYASSSPDRPPLVVEGDHVMPGQKMGLIEAMKIKKDVISTVKGKIIKVLIEDSQAVEYSQVLFQVDTSL
ncbi:MAG: biotin/lipoyl-containing protein [bacterium]